MRIAVVGIHGAWSSETLADAVGRATGERILVDMDLVRLDLAAGSLVCPDQLGRPVDLVARVRASEETTLEAYGDAVALIMAAEAAQLDQGGGVDPVHARDVLDISEEWHVIGDVVVVAP